MSPLNEEAVQQVVPAAETTDAKADEAAAEEVVLTPEQKTEQLSALMTDGKRELRAGNLQDAIDKFSQACEFAVAQYGPLEVESFEPNFLYGRALVELSCAETEVFQSTVATAKKGMNEMADAIALAVGASGDADESMTEEEKDEVRDMVADAIAENAEELEKEKAKKEAGDEKTEEKKEEAATATEEEATVEESDKKAEGEEEKKVDEAEKKEDAETEESAEEGGAADAEAAGDEEKEDIAETEESDAEDEEEGEGEAVDNAQLAWEALEVARVIADKMIEAGDDLDAWKRKKADIYVQIAQCSSCEEKYDEALEHLTQARSILEEIASSKYDRLVSETYFHEARIYRLRFEYEQAALAFEKAAETMTAVLEHVKSTAGDAPSDDAKEEMTDLQSVIDDFRARAEDSKGSAASKKAVDELAEKEKAEGAKVQQPTVLTTSNGNTDATANDISGLVRKKRAHDETATESAGDAAAAGNDETAAKKAKSEEEEVESKGAENVAV